jgi:hypothetical protein
LRTLTYHLHSFAKKLKLKSSSSKTKSKWMCGKDIKRVTIMIDGKITEQVTEL